MFSVIKIAKRVTSPARLAIILLLVSSMQFASANPNFTRAGILSFSADSSKCQLKVRGYFKTTSPKHVQYKYQWRVSGHPKTPPKTRTTTTYKPAPKGSKHPYVYGYWDDVIKLKKSTTGKVLLIILSHTSSYWEGPIIREFSMNCGVKLNPNILKPSGVRQQTAPTRRPMPKVSPRIRDQ